MNLGHVRSKIRSLGHMIEKACNCSRCHIFASIFLKFRQNVYLYDIKVKSNLGHVGSKSRSLGQIIEKKTCKHS